MRKALVILSLALMAATSTTMAQIVPSRANVIPYYDESAIEKNAYRDSPYYMELADGWQRSATDSSILYERQLDVEKDWRNFRIYLNVRASRGVRVTLNGIDLGAGGDSRHWNECLLDPALRYGRANTLVVEALTQPREALLEAQSQPVGFNGNPYLLFKNDPNVSDYTLVADYDAASGSGTLTLAADLFCGKRKGKYYLEVELWDPKGHSFDRMGRWVVFNGRSEETVDLSRSWTGVQPWNAETPVLYTAIIRLRDENMQEEETVGTRFGFRRIEVKDGQLQLNGKAITLKGVTYGKASTDSPADRERMKQDIETMKRHNINAVRTSRLSPIDPFFYELCDRYGLYVVADANLMPLSEQQQVVATDPEYLPLFERRVENLYGRYKNHTSIIAWSLGDTRDNGLCMTAAYKRLKAKEKSRPVIFSGAEHGESTDIIAPMHPDPSALRQSLNKAGDRPTLMLVAVGPDDFPRLEALWRLVENQRQLQGGFVDGWPLSTAQLSELKHLFSPFNVQLEKLMPDDGQFVVFNRNDFSSLGRYSLDYNVFTNHRSAITGGALPMVVPCGGSDKVQMRIPHVDLQPGEELFVRFTLATRRSEMAPWQTPADLTMGTVEFPLPQQTPRRALVNDGEPVSDSTRIPVDLFFEGHMDWTAWTVGRLVRRPDERTLCIDNMLRYTAPDGSVMCDVRTTYTRFSTGDVVVDYTLSGNDRIPADKLRPMILLRSAGDSVSWFGLDREVAFKGRNSGLVGTYTVSTSSPVARQKVRWCATHKGGGGLFAEMLGEQFDMLDNGVYLRIYPQSSSTFRLHLRPYSQQLPNHFYGTRFPRMTMGMLEPPAISADEVRFSQPLTIRLASQAGSEIRYTLDGSEPNESSTRYGGPFVINATTVVKARAFAKDMPPSFTSTRKFNYDYIVSTTFSRKANTPYNIGTDTLLFDGERGSVDQLNRGWLGFSGEPVVTTVQLAKTLPVESVVVRYAHSPATWAFAPRRVVVALSADGVAFTDTLSVDIPFDPADAGQQEPRVVEVRIPVGRPAGMLRIIPQTLQSIPAWHRAKGLKPWLMMDEIEVVEGTAKP